MGGRAHPFRQRLCLRYEVAMVGDRVGSPRPTVYCFGCLVPCGVAGLWLSTPKLNSFHLCGVGWQGHGRPPEILIHFSCWGSWEGGGVRGPSAYFFIFNNHPKFHQNSNLGRRRQINQPTNSLEIWPKLAGIR